jgi:hypothetical protein
MQTGLILAALAAAAATEQTCNPLTPAGTDYSDANVTVVPNAYNDSYCCDVCAKHNAALDPSAANFSTLRCVISVWHNHKPGGVCAIKASADHPFKGHLVIAMQAPPPPPPPPPAFRFSSVYTDHMVLQAAPARAVVWGFCNAASNQITVTLDAGDPLYPTVSPRPDLGEGLATWSVTLPATAASVDTSHVIEATGTHGGGKQSVARIGDVLFGDVWICSGQSNMAYALNGSNGQQIVHPPINDSQAEFASMLDYPAIRLLRAGHQKTSAPMMELLPADPGGSGPAVAGWTEPCPADPLSGKRTCRVDFSAMCW